jgi:hypothetical protein
MLEGGRRIVGSAVGTGTVTLTVLGTGLAALDTSFCGSGAHFGGIGVVICAFTIDGTPDDKAIKQHKRVINLMTSFLPYL